MRVREVVALALTREGKMGLDQYLTRKIYIGGEYKHRKVTGSIKIKIDGVPVSVDLKKVSYIEEKAGYWRKANQIHNWFVENVQGGVDDCGSHYVDREQLQELLDTVTNILDKVELVDGVLNNGYRVEGGVKTMITEQGKVVANPEVCEALPTASGFFFGNTDYNEWYVRDLEDTKQILIDALDEKYKHDEYEYRASW